MSKGGLRGREAGGAVTPGDVAWDGAERAGDKGEGGRCSYSPEPGGGNKGDPRDTRKCPTPLDSDTLE